MQYIFSAFWRCPARQLFDLRGSSEMFAVKMEIFLKKCYLGPRKFFSPPKLGARFPPLLTICLTLYRIMFTSHGRVSDYVASIVRPCEYIGPNAEMATLNQTS